MTTRTKKDLKPTTTEQVMTAIDENHIWINAFACINPSPKTCEDLGREILNMLADRTRVLPAYNSDIDTYSPSVRKTMLEMAELTPMLYLRINKS